MFATYLSRIATVAVAAITVLPVAAFAQVQNGGFETGGLNFFGSAGTATVVTAAVNGLGQPILPTEGVFFTCLSASGSAFVNLEAPLGYLPGTLGGLLGSISDGSIITQNVNVDAGASLCFDFYFDALGGTLTNDIGLFSVATAGVGDPIILADVVTVGNLNNTGWVSYEYVFADAGNYTVGFGALNGTLPITPSALYVDNIRLKDAGVGDVPEPGALAFGILSVGSVIGLIARKRRA